MCEGRREVRVKEGESQNVGQWQRGSSENVRRKVREIKIYELMRNRLNGRKQTKGKIIMIKMLKE